MVEMTAMAMRRAGCARAAWLALFLSWQTGCVSTPDTSLSEFPNGELHLASDLPVALLTIAREDDEAPRCAEETLRRYLPNGPDLDAVIFGEKVQEWLADAGDTPVISRTRLLEVAAQAGGDVSAFGPGLRYLAIIHGYSEHDEGSGTMDGADVIIVVRVDHTTVINLVLFDLDTGQRVNRWRIYSRGERYYGIAGVFPIIGYSDTAGSACEELDKALERVVEGASG